MPLLLDLPHRPSVAETSRMVSDVWGVRVDCGLPTNYDQYLFSRFIPLRSSSAERNISALVSTLESYPPDFIQGLGIKVVKFASLLEKKRSNFQSVYRVEGCMDLDNGILYAADHQDLEETLHHEIAHQILHKMPVEVADTFHEELFEINQRFGLKYQSSDRYYYARIRGFYSQYAASDIYEDIPETHAGLMMAPFEIIDNSQTDKALAEKIDLTLDVSDFATEGAMGKQWQRSLRSYQRFPFFKLLPQSELLVYPQ